MGLVVTNDCFSASYSTFTRMRNALARAAGYAVQPIVVADGWRHETALIDWGHLPPEHLMGEWDAVPDDPLLILIAHSDCDGLIRAIHAGKLASRIAELAPLGADLVKTFSNRLGPRLRQQVATNIVLRQIKLLVHHPLPCLSKLNVDAALRCVGKPGGELFCELAKVPILVSDQWGKLGYP